MLINYGRNVCKYPLNSKTGNKSGWGLGGDNLVPKGRKEEGAWELGCGEVVMNATNCKTGRA